MEQNFFFYDLETSGLDPRSDRIMQFAGQRTDMSLNPIGEPYNLLVALNDDTLPSPDALMVTGITPQETVDEGYTEAQFVKILSEEIFTEDTIAVGFNNGSCGSRRQSDCQQERKCNKRRSFFIKFFYKF